MRLITLNLKAKTAKADMVVDTDGLNKLGANKRESRKFVGKSDFLTRLERDRMIFS